MQETRTDATQMLYQEFISAINPSRDKLISFWIDDILILTNNDLIFKHLRAGQHDRYLRRLRAHGNYGQLTEVSCFGDNNDFKQNSTLKNQLKHSLLFVSPIKKFATARSKGDRLFIAFTDKYYRRMWEYVEPALDYFQEASEIFAKGKGKSELPPLTVKASFDNDVLEMPYPEGIKTAAEYKESKKIIINTIALAIADLEEEIEQ